MIEARHKGGLIEGTKPGANGMPGEPPFARLEKRMVGTIWRDGWEVGRREGEAFGRSTLTHARFVMVLTFAITAAMLLGTAIGWGLTEVAICERP